MGLQPALNGLQILVRETEPCADLLRREPAVIFGRSGVVHIVDQLMQRRFALRRGLENEQHVLEAQVSATGPRSLSGLNTAGGVLPSSVTRCDSTMRSGEHGFGALGERSSRAQNQESRRQN